MVLSRNVENSTKWSFYCLTWQQWGVDVVNHFQIIDDMSDNYAEIIEDVSDEDNDPVMTREHCYQATGELGLVDIF